MAKYIIEIPDNCNYNILKDVTGKKCKDCCNEKCKKLGTWPEEDACFLWKSESEV